MDAPPFVAQRVLSPGSNIFRHAEDVRLVYALVALPLAAALLVNGFSIGLDDAYGGRGPDADEVLVWASIVGAVLVAFIVARRADDSSSDATLASSLAAGAVTFVLSWVPLLVVVLLYPPT